MGDLQTKCWVSQEGHKGCGNIIIVPSPSQSLFPFSLSLLLFPLSLPSSYSPFTSSSSHSLSLPLTPSHFISISLLSPPVSRVIVLLIQPSSSLVPETILIPSCNVLSSSSRVSLAFSSLHPVMVRTAASTLQQVHCKNCSKYIVKTAVNTL